MVRLPGSPRLPRWLAIILLTSLVAGAAAYGVSRYRSSASAPVVVAGRLTEDASHYRWDAVDKSSEAFLLNGDYRLDGFFSPSNEEWINRTKPTPDGRFALRAGKGQFASDRDGYADATVVVFRWDDLDMFAHGYCTRRKVQVKLVRSDGHDVWVDRNGDPITLTLEILHDEAHLCWSPALP